MSEGGDQHQVEVESVTWKIIYGRHFFSKSRSDFSSAVRFVGSRIVSILLFVLYACFVAAFVISFFGLVPLYIVQFFEPWSAPWAAEPILHGFKFYLLLSTLVVIGLLIANHYAREEGSRRMFKQITFIYCSIAIPLTLLELINTYPAQWTASEGLVMDRMSWTLYFSGEMLDAILLGHFKHFFDVAPPLKPDTWYVKTLLFMAKIYFATAATWYFYYKIRFRMTGSITVNCTLEQLRHWLPRWAKAQIGVDAEKVTFVPIALHTNIERVAKPQTFRETFHDAPSALLQEANESEAASMNGEWHPAIYELPMVAVAGMMSAGAFVISLLSIPVMSQSWVDAGLTFLKYYGYFLGAVFGAFAILTLALGIAKARKARRSKQQSAEVVEEEKNDTI